MMLNYEDARDLVFRNVTPLEKCTLPLTESQGLALSDDIPAPHGMPSFDNSGVDGYAVQAKDSAEATVVNPIMLENLGYVDCRRFFGKRKCISGQCIPSHRSPLPKGANFCESYEGGYQN